MKRCVTALACITVAFAAAPALALAQGAPPDPSGYACPPGYKQVAKVCLAPDQQHARCLYPETPGGKPKEGDLQDANPAACPRHPPGEAHPH